MYEYEYWVMGMTWLYVPSDGRSGTSPDMCAESYYSMLVPIICDLKPCVTYVEHWIFGSRDKATFPGGEVIKMPITFGVKIGLMISVDLRHGQGEKHSCLLLLYSPAQVASYVRDLYLLWTTSVYMYIRYAISNHLFFHCRGAVRSLVEIWRISENNLDLGNFSNIANTIVWRRV
jgi:hypothetical protein